MKGILTVFLIACCTSGTIAQKFLGYWEIMTIQKSDEKELRPRTNWIEFFDGGTFAIGQIGAGIPARTGEWIYDKKARSIKLISNRGQTNDGTYVILESSEDRMTLEMNWKTLFLERGIRAVPLVVEVNGIENKVHWLQTDIEGNLTQHPAMDDRAIYLGSDKMGVSCISRKSGRIIWEAPLEQRFRGVFHTIAQSDSYLYFNGMQGGIYKVRKKDGKIIWWVDAPFDDDMLNKMILKDDMLYLNPLDRSFLALDTNGIKVWQTSLPEIVFSYTMADDKIYAYCDKGELIILNAVTGEIVGRRKAGEPALFYPTPVVVSNKLLVCDLATKTLRAFDAKSDFLNQIWENSEQQVTGIYASNGIVCYLSDNAFGRISPKDGSIIWSVPGDFKRICEPTFFDGKVYLQSRKEFIIVDAKTGEIEHRSVFERKSFMQPIVTNNAIYVGYEGNLLKLKHP